MGERNKIGIIFNQSSDWVAASYYILNLIEALKTLPQEKTPKLVIFSYHEKDFDTMRQLQYPFIEYALLPVLTPLQHTINKISRRLLYRNIAKARLGVAVDVLFPSLLLHSGNHRDLFWIPDFQEKYFPGFFSARELSSRNNMQTIIAKSKSGIVFSSMDSLNDFRKFFPFSKVKTFCLPFAVTHPDYNNLDFENLKEKYQVREPYFFAPNQFWVHKNQLTILKAIKIAAKENPSMLVAFSGKEEDYRVPGHFKSLQQFVEENKLQDNVRFLGFIDRKEQLKLMQRSVAVLQASLFEGWSTVVEDAKAMGKQLIVSNLAVHREQLHGNAVFFETMDDIELAKNLIHFYNMPPQSSVYDYSAAVRKFGENFLSIIDQTNQ